MKPQKQHPKMNLAPGFVQHLAGKFWPPEIETGEHRKHDGAEDDVMEVGDNKICIGNVKIERRSRKNDAGQPSEEEGDQESQAPQHGGFKRDRTAPHRTDPVNEFD